MRFANVLSNIAIVASTQSISASSSSEKKYLRSIQDERATQSIDEPPIDIDIDIEEPESLIAQQFTVDPYASRDKMEMILNGEVTLAGLRYHPTSFSINDDNEDGEGEDSYTEVYGEFCVFNSQLNKQNPSYYPTAQDAMADSEHCGEHRYTILLSDVMDAIEKSSSSSPDAGGIKTLPLSGLLYHQGYAGAGLISNVLSTFPQALVISEHSAIHSALSACDTISNRYNSNNNCSPAKQTKLVRDIITLLSRTSDMTMEHLFLKLESSSAAYLPMLRTMYPDTKWTFSYRNAEETLSKSMERKRNVTCMKARRNPTSALVTKSTTHNVNLESLTSHEVCALHLSTLLEEAVKEHDKSKTGLLVSYDDIVSSNVIIDEVLPYFGLQVPTPEMEDKIHTVLSTRSNARGKNMMASTEWKGGEEEEIEISPEISNAVKKFMSPMMDDTKVEM